MLDIPQETEDYFWVAVGAIRENWYSVRRLKKVPASYVLAATLVSAVRSKIVNTELRHLVDEIQDLREEIKCLRKQVAP